MTHNTLLPYQSFTYGTGGTSVGRIPSCGGGVAPVTASVTGQVPGARNNAVAVLCVGVCDVGDDAHPDTERAATQPMLTIKVLTLEMPVLAWDDLEHDRVRERKPVYLPRIAPGTAKIRAARSLPVTVVRFVDGWLSGHHEFADSGCFAEDHRRRAIELLPADDPRTLVRGFAEPKGLEVGPAVHAPTRVQDRHALRAYRSVGVYRPWPRPGVKERVPARQRRPSVLPGRLHRAGGQGVSTGGRGRLEADRCR